MNGEAIVKRIALAVIAISIIHLAIWAMLVGSRGVRAESLG